MISPLLFAPAPTWLKVLLAAIGAAILLLTTPFLLRPRRRVVVRFHGLSWNRAQFCRGWLITGDTGSGKTSSGINQMLHQVFQNEPNWGGLCIDEKGVYWETLCQMAQHYGREHDLVHLELRLELATNWEPKHRFNLLGDPTIPAGTYAKFVVDTATSLGQGGDKGFFRAQAQTHIDHAIRLLRELGEPVTLPRCSQLLTQKSELNLALEELKIRFPSPQREAVIAHFESRLINQPPEQYAGVRETIGNYLQFFLADEVAQVFCGPNTFEFRDIENGKILCITMPQKFQTERRYINTFLKLLFYTTCLRRFDRPKSARAEENLLILWADESQRFVTASEDGISDYNCVDVIREAQATVVAAAQSTTSFIPPLGQDKARVLILNLRNRLIFRSADEADAVQNADFVGKHSVVKTSWGYSGGKRSRNFHETDEHRLKPHDLRKLRDHQCILVHCDQGFRKVTLPPVDAQGRVAPWFSWVRRILGA